jgi:hypothetical protein
VLQNFTRLFLVAIIALQFPALTGMSTETEMRSDDRASAPSKLCHPKKPVTCRANDLANAAPALATPSESQQAALCFGPRWLCRTGADVTTPAETDALPEAPVTKPADSTIESQQAALCFGPRWLCRSEGLI